MDRKKQTSSGPRPDKSRETGKQQASTTGVDEAWEKLSDPDLVELADLLDVEDDDAPGELAPVPVGARRGTIPDLPAPVGPSSSRAAGKAASKASLVDLPAPVGPVPRKNIPDLLAPVGPRPTRPTPPQPAPPAATAPATVTAPATTRTGSLTPPVTRPDIEPQRPHARAAPAPSAAPPPTAMPDDIDLPAPVGPLATKQLPDLLAPVGPAPSTRTPADLPAPKGFFDDGLQPKSSSAGAALPAPKGFFDDGVQPRLGPANAAPGSEPLDLDFGFELGESPSRAAARLDQLDPIEGAGDLPGLGPGPRAGAGAAAGASGMPAFDLGDPVSTGGVNRPFGLDADDLDLEQSSDVTPPPLTLELSDGPLSDPARMPRSRTSRMEMELGGAGEAPVPMPMPASPSGGVTFGRPSAGPAAPDMARARADAASDPFAPGRSAGHLLTTEIKLEVDGAATPGAPRLPVAVTQRPGARAVVAPRKRPAAARSTVAARRRLMLLAGMLGVAAIAAGGYTGLKWWKGEKSRDASAASGIRQVEKLLADDSPRHWEQAVAEARRLAGDGANNLEPLAVVAEASFAAALDESAQAQERIKDGDRALATLRDATAKGPHARKAEALRAILSTNFVEAVKLLDEAKRAAPGDADAQLYLGWALAAQEQHARALPAYKAALGRGKPRIAALYGQGLSQLELGDNPAATRSFQTVIQASRDRYKRDHLGALIGLAQLAPVSERDSRYQELLARPDLASAPPRAVSRLRALAGDEALRAGRIDQARARYDEARALDPLNLRATVGVALVAAGAGDLDGARRKLTEVLEAVPDHIEATLALVEVAMAEKQREEAAALVDSLFGRRPSIANTRLLGRAHLARARVYDAAADPTVRPRAETEYREAMARADAGDFAATVGLSALLVRLGRKQEALDVLGPIKAAAQEDANLALTLGSAYLAAGQADVAAEAFRGVLARRPDDAEARFQLGHAYLAMGKFGEAIDSLRRAYETDRSREDIGLGLARTLEAAGRSRESVAAYEKMLAGEHKPSLRVRGQAGRAFARLGMAKEAAAQGQAIRDEDARDPTGMFLLGESLYGAGNYEEALKAYRDAARLDSEAQYFEALGRTSEKLAQYDEALRSYGDAIAADPQYLAPRLGRGRVRLIRREYTIAVSELEAAHKVTPDSAEVLRDLGRAHLAMRDLKNAVPLLERAAALDGQDPATHYALGDVYYDLDRPGAAAKHLSRAVEVAGDGVPWRAEAFRKLGYAQRAAGNRNGAISAWRRYLAIEKNDGPSRRDAQRMLMRLEAR